MKKSSNRLNRGFTLIEMLVVVAIIALLIGIILPGLLSSKTKARDAKRVSDLNQIQLAFEQYFNRCQQYPTNSGGAPSSPITLSTATALAYNNGCPAGVTLKTFISTIPNDPSTSSGYTYYFNPNPGATDYVLKATLESNQDSLKDSLTAASLPTWAAAVQCNAGAGSLVYCIGPQ